MIGSRSAVQTVDQIAAGLRFTAELSAFIRRPLHLDRARAILRRRLERRANDFLEQADRAIFAQPENPYHRLLDLAGCERGDLTDLVARYGLEGALALLFRRGVYLTVPELKGRQPVVRGSASFTLDPSQLRNPDLPAQALHQTSGSRGARTTVPINLAYLRANAVNTSLALAARGGLGWSHAIWSDPGSAVLVQILFCAFGAPLTRAFLQLDPAAPAVPARYRWSDRGLRLAGYLAGRRLPRPEYVPLDTPLPIGLWLVTVLRSGRTPHLITFASPAVRLAQVALDAGFDLRGAQLSVGGEPLTAARRALIQASGAEVQPHYGTVEAGGIGTECLAPVAPDDVHVSHDRLALIQPGSAGETVGLPPRALLVTSLRRTAPFVLLNASLGDQAELTERACGCPREQPGYTTHLVDIRSFEKLTAGGMTFVDVDVVRVLEELLPARFGGAPIDYQLVEDELSDGRPTLRLLVHPAVGPLAADEVLREFLSALGSPSERERVMALQWAQSNLLTLERRPPLTTASGKILHLHLNQRSDHPADH